MELWAFFGVWLVSFLHAAARDRAACRDQIIAIGVLGALAVMLFWATPGLHSIAAWIAGMETVATMDLTILLGALVAFVVARRPTLSNAD